MEDAETMLNRIEAEADAVAAELAELKAEAGL